MLFCNFNTTNSPSSRKKFRTLFSVLAIFIFLGSSFLPAFAGTAHAQGGAGVAASVASLAALRNTSNQGQQTPQCLNFLSINLKGCFEGFLALVSTAIFQIFGSILTLASMLLNYVVEKTITTMSATIRDIGGINAAWSTIRDLANMCFIFVLLYQAILIVIQQNKASIGTTIKNVVIAALLINFSLFFTKVAIDASNILTVGIYEGIRTAQNLAYNNTDSGRGLSDAIMQPLGITKINDPATTLNTIQRGGAMAIVINTLFGTVIMMIAAVVFCIVAFMLVARFVILVFLLILSPLAFIGNVIPQTQQYSRQWTSTLTGQLLFAPVLMLMFWIIIRIMTDPTFGPFNNANQFSSFASAGAQNPFPAVSLIFNYVIIISFLVGSVIIAKQTATQGGGAAGQLMGKMQGWGSKLGGAATFGAAGYGLRRTVGAGANKFANSKTADRLRTAPMGVGWVSRRGLNKLDEKVAKNSFDMRNTGVGQNLGTGAGQKGGFVAYKKSKDEEKKEVARIEKKIETQNSINSGVKARDEKAKLEKDRKNKEAQLATATAAGNTAAMTTLTGEIAALTAQITTHADKENIARRTLQTLDSKGVDELGKNLEHEFVAQNLAPQKFAAAMKSEKHDDGRKTKMAAARYKEMDTAVEGKTKLDTVATTRPLTPAEQAELAEHEKTVKDTVPKLSTQDMEYVNPSHFSNEAFATNISSGAHETLTKPDHALLTGSQKGDLSAARIAPAKRALDTTSVGYTPTQAYDTLLKLDAKTAATLDVALLTNSDAIESYSQGKLTEMAKNMDAAKRSAFKTAFLANAAPFVAAGNKDMINLEKWMTTGKGRRMYS